MFVRKKATAGDDTIVAIITPPGEGGVAALRLAGGRSRELLGACFDSQSGKVKSIIPFMMRYGRYLDRDGAVLDEVMAVFMPGGKSYTGLDQAEIYCHGGRHVVRLILDDLIARGARPAEPGEFTKLAFLSGRIDLTRAEAVAEIIAANTDASYQSACEHLLGRYAELVEQLRESLVTLLADVEAALDFGEEDIEPAENKGLSAAVRDLAGQIKELVDSYSGGRIINEGYRVVIGGRPNAGKSSLFNLLLKQERALVNPTAGTTRDYLSEWVDLGGYAVNLIDTAGLRQGGGAIEKQGQNRAERIIAGADLLLWMVDLTQKGWQDRLKADLKTLKAKHIFIIGNKIDIAEGVISKPPLVDGELLLISCLTGKGLRNLSERLVERINATMPDLTAGVVVTSARHRQKLAEARKHLRAADKKIASGESTELIAFDLRQATKALDEITGRVYTEDILDRIFSSFCIGK